MAQPGFKLSLKGRALRLLSQREHSRAELVRKLSAHEEVPGDLAQALDDLQPKVSSTKPASWNPSSTTVPLN